MSRDPIWDALKENTKNRQKELRAENLAKAAELDDGQWTKHTDYHWSRFVDGSKLDYWPSKSKWQFRGKIRRGDVYAFIKRNQ